MSDALPSSATEPSPGAPKRTVGLVGATGVGIGAIVGGGILVLAGVAFRATGPSALVAFAVNGAIAVLTALSFAEMATAFPESGGAYTFAKKVLSVRAAFGVGWILWFAYIVAGVLYALGFASYAVAIVQSLWRAATGVAPEWLSGRTTTVAFALAATAAYTLSLIRKATGGGEVATWGKVVVFILLILAGCWAFVASDAPELDHLTPFFPNGTGGLLQAMGFTFIALQGFDLIAAIAGEVKEPNRTIPKAMLLSLGAALLIYLPLLFVVSTVGVSDRSTIERMSAENPETVMAVAVRNFLGVPGYWLVMIAAVLSTLSALHANLLAASRVALTMAGDRTLPAILGHLHATRRTPVLALYASALALVAILLMVPDLAAAGAAASLIFLIAFALAHWTSILARRRAGLDAIESTESQSNSDGAPRAKPFQAPWFPAVPVIGGSACVVMAVFQGFAVPAAGGITAVWLGLGGLLYFALFSSRAEAHDAFEEAHDPALVRLRGRSPLVLVPVSNPASAPAMVGVAAALAPPRVGRVMLFSVIRQQRDSQEGTLQALESTQSVLHSALVASFRSGHRPEALMTVAAAPWAEIARVARAHRCEGLLLGVSDEMAAQQAGGHLEELMNTVDCDVTFLRAPVGWSVGDARRILVPVGGRGAHVELRARLLGSLVRMAPRQTTWLRTLPEGTSEAARRDAERALRRFAVDKARIDPHVEVVVGRDPLAVIGERAQEHDLLVLGLQRLPSGRRVFGSFAVEILRRAPCATLLLSSRS